jgi:hypothetical protein
MEDDIIWKLPLMDNIPRPLHIGCNFLASSNRVCIKLCGKLGHLRRPRIMCGLLCKGREVGKIAVFAIFASKPRRQMTTSLSIAASPLGFEAHRGLAWASRVANGTMGKPKHLQMVVSACRRELP